MMYIILSGGKLGCLGGGEASPLSPLVDETLMREICRFIKKLLYGEMHKFLPTA